MRYLIVYLFGKILCLKKFGKKVKEENLEKASFLISKVGLSKDDAFLFPSELSGGMKKESHLLEPYLMTQHFYY